MTINFTTPLHLICALIALTGCNQKAEFSSGNSRKATTVEVPYENCLTEEECDVPTTNPEPTPDVPTEPDPNIPPEVPDQPAPETPPPFPEPNPPGPDKPSCQNDCDVPPPPPPPPPPPCAGDYCEPDPLDCEWFYQQNQNGGEDLIEICPDPEDIYYPSPK